MQKILELIEQVRFAELKKIDKLTNSREEYGKHNGDCNQESIN